MVVYSGPLHSGDAENGIVTAPLTGDDQLLTKQLLSTVQPREIAVNDDDGIMPGLGRAQHVARQPPGVTGDTRVRERGERTRLQIAIDDTYSYFTAFTKGGEQAILLAPK